MRSLNADISNVDYCGTMHHSVTQAKAEQETKEGKKGRKKEKNGLRKLKTPKKKKGFKMEPNLQHVSFYALNLTATLANGKLSVYSC